LICREKAARVSSPFTSTHCRKFDEKNPQQTDNVVQTRMGRAITSVGNDFRDPHRTLGILPCARSCTGVAEAPRHETRRVIGRQVVPDCVEAGTRRHGLFKRSPVGAQLAEDAGHAQALRQVVHVMCVRVRAIRSPLVVWCPAWNCHRCAALELHGLDR